MHMRLTQGGDRAAMGNGGAPAPRLGARTRTQSALRDRVARPVPGASVGRPCGAGGRRDVRRAAFCGHGPAESRAGLLVGRDIALVGGMGQVGRRPIGGSTSTGADYLLTGHKFFCSAPMCDAFLVLARTDADEISCFLVPRWQPDGTRNALYIERLKDKLGNRSNASCEIEFPGTYGQLIGEEGRGSTSSGAMVAGHRLCGAESPAGFMRQALVQALHHTSHRRAFQKRLIDQPLMRAVLADMAIEVEAALALALRIARAMDNAEADASEAMLARIGTAVAKYWNCKRAPALVFEALECHGGPGYIEDCIMPRLYREAPVNSIWEGSANMMALDVLRAVTREPGAAPAFFTELELARGDDAYLDRAIDDLRAELATRDGLEGRMRVIAEKMALTMQGALLTRHGAPEVAAAFCAARLGNNYRGTFGTLPAGCDLDAIIARCAGMTVPRQ